ncbi:MAG TPA: pyrroline-5-carboxylate reductase, partial [Gammaproteobacteria bacterium]|nr:pyrroline-5-carboxylate reductase [Gammaproteobacteria bacterium]
MKSTIGIIGAGNMGSSLIGGLIKNGYPAQNLWISDHGKEKLEKLHDKWGIQTTQDNLILSQKADTIVLAVKPKDMKALLLDLSDGLNTHCPLFISIAAGITTQKIQNWLKNTNVPIIRAMPNTPALLGCGITGLYAASTLNPALCQRAEELLSAVGQTVWIPNEALMDVVTALSGSGPAYFFYVMESLIEGGVQLGLPLETARKLT